MAILDMKKLLEIRLLWIMLIDFSESVRSIDVGMSLGAHYAIDKRFFALAQLDYGFNNIMKTGFESISFGLHNIFMNVGIGYKLK